MWQKLFSLNLSQRSTLSFSKTEVLKTIVIFWKDGVVLLNVFYAKNSPFSFIRWEIWWVQNAKRSFCSSHFVHLSIEISIKLPAWFLLRNLRRKELVKFRSPLETDVLYLQSVFFVLRWQKIWQRNCATRLIFCSTPLFFATFQKICKNNCSVNGVGFLFFFSSDFFCQTFFLQNYSSTVWLEQKFLKQERVSQVVSIMRRAKFSSWFRWQLSELLTVFMAQFVGQHGSGEVGTGSSPFLNVSFFSNNRKTPGVSFYFHFNWSVSQFSVGALWNEIVIFEGTLFFLHKY